MRKIRDALRLAANGLSPRKIVPSHGIGRSTLRDYLKRAMVAGLTWPLPEELSDGDLDNLLFSDANRMHKLSTAEPDYPTMHQELRRKGVTLYLLWLEYREDDPDGYGYYCDP